MLTLKITPKGLTVNGKPLSLPAPVATVEALLGPARFASLKYNDLHTWDNHGIHAYGKKRSINSLSISYQVRKNPFNPTQVFRGQLVYDGQDISEPFSRYQAGERKRYAGDGLAQLRLGGIGVYFNVDDGRLESIDLSPVKPEQSVEHPPATVAAEFDYLKTSWADWIAAIKKQVTPANEYYNLLSGISDEIAHAHKQLSEGLEIPAELINFYKINDVSYDGVTAIFGYSINNWQYDLIPFTAIKEEWENIQDLQLEDSLEEGLTDGYDTAVQAKDYANPHWIPFATGRNGDYLLFDTDPSPQGTYGQIIELVNEDWTRVVVAGSLQKLITKEVETIRREGAQRFAFILGLEE